MFAAAQVLPGDIGRNVLGPFASQQDVDNYNKALGLDRPLVVQYWDWFSHFLRGDLGTSLQYKVPVSDLIWPAFRNSLKLAAVAPTRHLHPDRRAPSSGSCSSESPTR